MHLSLGRAARRLLGRRTGLGLARVRLAGDGGRRPGVGADARPPRRPHVRPLSPRPRRRLLPPVGAPQGRQGPRALRPRRARRAARARAARPRAPSCSELSPKRGEAPRTAVDPPRAIAEDLGVIPPFVRESLARARNARLPRPPLGEGRRHLPRPARLPERQRRLRGARTTPRRSTRGGPSSPSATARSFAQRAGVPAGRRGRRGPLARAPRRHVPREVRPRAGPRAGAPRREGPHQHAGDRGAGELELAAPRRRSRTWRRTRASARGFAAIRGARRVRRGDDGGRAGVAVPLWAAPATGGASTSRSSASTRSPSSFASSTRRVPRRGSRSSRAPTHVWHVVPARRRARAAVRVARPRPVRARRGRPLQPQQAPRRPVRARRRGRARHARPGLSAYPRDATAPTRRRRRVRPARRRGVQAEVASSSTTLRLGRRPRRRACPGSETVVYEVHVQRLHPAHPGVPEALRGKFLGARVRRGDRAPARRSASRPSSSCPSTPTPTSRRSSRAGSTNYWGYNTLAYFAPDARFARERRRAGAASSGQMVKRLHAAGIEVVLDVVYNHTCEGDRFGPTRQLPRHRRPRVLPARAASGRAEYVDVTGCGNTLDVSHPQVLKLVTDSLRYWAPRCTSTASASTSLRRSRATSSGDFDPRSAFFAAVHQDPVLSRVKLIAEPWDLGDEAATAWAVSPIRWSEYNGRYRDTVRRFWHGDRKRHRRSRLPAHRLERPLRRRRAHAAGEHQLRHRPRRLHAARSRQLRDEAQRGERRGQPRRRAERHEPERGVEGETDDPA